MLENLRSVVTKVISPICRWLLRIGVTPDAVTWAGTIGTVLVSMVFFPQGWLWQGVVVLLVFIFSDLLDGTMARQSGRSSKWGAFLDSTLDRIADGAVFGGLALYFAGPADSVLWCGAAIGALVFGSHLLQQGARRITGHPGPRRAGWTRRPAVPRSAGRTSDRARHCLGATGRSGDAVHRRRDHGRPADVHRPPGHPAGGRAGRRGAPMSSLVSAPTQLRLMKGAAAIPQVIWWPLGQLASLVLAARPPKPLRQWALNAGVVTGRSPSYWQRRAAQFSWIRNSVGSLQLGRWSKRRILNTVHWSTMGPLSGTGPTRVVGAASYGQLGPVAFGSSIRLPLSSVAERLPPGQFSTSVTFAPFRYEDPPRRAERGGRLV